MIKPRSLKVVLAPLCVLALTGCGRDVIEYDGPGVPTWGPPRVRWEVPRGGAALVVNRGSDDVSVLDLAARSTLMTVRVGVEPIVANAPRRLALDTIERWFYTALAPPARGDAGTDDARRGVLVKRSIDDFRLSARASVDPEPWDVALSRNNRHLYVSHDDPAGRATGQRSRVLVVDADSMTAIAQVPVCVGARGLAPSPDGATLYVACHGDGAVGVVTLAPPWNVALVPLDGGAAQGLATAALAPGGHFLYVGADEGRAVHVFDTMARRFDPGRTIRDLGGRPGVPEFTPDGGSIFVPVQDRDAVVRVRLGGAAVLERRVDFAREQCVRPRAVRRGHDGAYYVVCEGDPARGEPGAVLALDAATLTPGARYTAGLGADAIGFVRAPGTEEGSQP